VFVPAAAKNPLHSIATEIIFGGSRGKTRRSEIWFYLIRVPNKTSLCQSTHQWRTNFDTDGTVRLCLKNQEVRTELLDYFCDT
ncbi:MAG: hypothetical protein ACJAWN_003079, partial [Neolewinella sp.]